MKRISRAFSPAPSWMGISLVILTSLLAAGLWELTTPLAQAATSNGQTMLAAALQSTAPGKTLGNASRSQFLAAEGAAITQNPGSEVAVVRAALSLRPKLRDRIIKEAVQVANGNCDLIHRIYEGVTSGLAETDRNNYLELFTANCPTCFGAAVGTGEFANPSGNINPPSGSIAGGGGGFNPQEATVLLCYNNMQVNVPASKVDAYVASHPGTTLGVCQMTVTTNK